MTPDFFLFQELGDDAEPLVRRRLPAKSGTRAAVPARLPARLRPGRPGRQRLADDRRRAASRGQCYKTFYGRKLQPFLIS